MLPWQLLPHLPYLALLLCWGAFCIPRNASLQSHSIVLSFLHFWRYLMHSLVAQAYFSCVGKNYFVSMLPWQHLPHLPWPNSHHLLVCFLYSKKYITPKSEYCAVFSPLLEGVDAFFGGTSFLLMCWKELLCLHASTATPSTLALA